MKSYTLGFSINVNNVRHRDQYTLSKKSKHLIDRHRHGSELMNLVVLSLIKARGEKPSCLTRMLENYAFDISLGSEVPYQKFLSFTPQEQAIFFPYVRALNPEVDGNNFTKSWGRLTQTFGDRAEGIGRSMEHSKNVFQSDVKLYQTLKNKDFMNGYDIDSGEWKDDFAEAKAQSWLKDQAFMESAKQGGYGFGVDEIDVLSKDFQKRLFKGRQEEKEFAIQRAIKKSSRKMYQSEGLLEDIMVEGISMGADLGATILLSSVPIIGKPLAMGYTSSVFYGDYVDTLVYDHNVSLEDAQRIGKVATIPYALAEMGQANVLKNALKGTSKDTAERMLSKFPQWMRENGANYAKEVGQESFQASVEGIGKAYAKEFADAEGVEYDELVQDWWDETIMAMKALVLPTSAGGAVGAYRKMKGGSFGSIEHSSNVGSQTSDIDVLPQDTRDKVEALDPDVKQFYEEAQTFEEQQGFK